MKTVTFDETMWKLAPVEPTHAMLGKADGLTCIDFTALGEEGAFTNDELRAIYQAFLAAAPQPPKEQAMNNREAFEVWAQSYSSLGLERDAHGHYLSIEQEMLWHAWQAAKKNAPEGAFGGESGASTRLSLAKHDSTSEWDVRGHLAATLTCWHRLTGQEAAELVAMFRGRPAPAQAQEPFGYFRAEPFGWTDCASDDEGAKALYEHPAPQQPAPAVQGDALTISEADQLEKVITDFDEYGETDVPDTAIQRFAAMGYLECVHYNVLPAAQEAIDAARSQAKEGA